MKLNRIPDIITLEHEGEAGDARAEIKEIGGNFEVFVTAKKDKPTFLRLSWREKLPADMRVLGDTWERSYADLGFRSIGDGHAMPWYFMAVSAEGCSCFGVKTGAHSFVSFRCDESGVSCLIDLRSGSYGVRLDGRTLCACTFVFRDYGDMKPFAALSDFCRKLCDKPLAPKVPVYGGNNWYYAYGKSSRAEILSDALLQARLAGDNENRPYMVVDDCWEKNILCGPWEPNDSFGDMKTLADELRELGVKPGIWVRFLNTQAAVPVEWRMDNKPDGYLDPSVPEVLDFIKADMKKLCEWGYELIKHDFSTYDIFGDWGKDLNDLITNKDNLRFHDDTRTSAEIVLDLYRAILEEAGDAVIIGCNTISHLAAGLCHLNRIGDDTSGKEWERTRDFGVNTLSFRLCQHRAFYDADADCVGVLGDNIPWEKNSQWLMLLAKSGTPLFVSCPDGVLTEEQIKQLQAAYRLASTQQSSVEPLDWLETRIPHEWKCGEETLEFDWA